MPDDESHKQIRNGVSINYRLLAFMGYWSPLLSLITGYYARKESKFALFHSIQGGAIGLALIISTRILQGSLRATDASLFAALLHLVVWLLGVALLLSGIFLMISAFWGKRYHLPLVGRFFESLADRWFVDTKKVDRLDG
jgi:uncharacterized membrane protein